MLLFFISSSKTSSSESGENRDGKLAKTEKFHVVAQEDINKYDFPAELAEYANEYCNKFLPEKETKESILYDHPVPNNIQGINRLNSFMRDSTLKDKGKELLIESILEKVHQMTKDAYGPLARMWSYLEEISSSRDETVDVEIDIFLTFTQQTVLSLAQAISSLLYRRYSSFSSCMPYSDLKILLKERSSTMENEGDLFGREFRHFITVNRKAKNQTMAVLKPRKQIKPFRLDPSSAYGQRNGGG